MTLITLTQHVLPAQLRDLLAYVLPAQLRDLLAYVHQAHVTRAVPALLGHDLQLAFASSIDYAWFLGQALNRLSRRGPVH